MHLTLSPSTMLKLALYSFKLLKYSRTPVMWHEAPLALYHVLVTMEVDRHANGENSSSNMAANASISAVAAMCFLGFPFFLLGHWLEICPSWWQAKHLTLLVSNFFLLPCLEEVLSAELFLLFPLPFAAKARLSSSSDFFFCSPRWDPSRIYSCVKSSHNLSQVGIFSLPTTHFTNTSHFFPKPFKEIRTSSSLGMISLIVASSS